MNGNAVVISSHHSWKHHQKSFIVAWYSFLCLLVTTVKYWAQICTWKKVHGENIQGTYKGTWVHVDQSFRYHKLSSKSWDDLYCAWIMFVCFFLSVLLLFFPQQWLRIKMRHRCIPQTSFFECFEISELKFFCSEFTEHHRNKNS